MIVAEQIDAVRRELARVRQAGRTVGLVPRWAPCTRGT